MLKTVSGLSFEPVQKYTDLKDEKLIEKTCPMCGNVGFKVMKVTVSNHVNSVYWKHLTDKWYFFCPTPECEMVYYNNKMQVYFSKIEVKTVVFHKEKDQTRPVCYCLSVTEDVIREEIFEKGCCDTFEDIQKYTKAGTGRWCPITNPSGRCCKEYLEPLVENLLKEAGLHIQVKEPETPEEISHEEQLTPSKVKVIVEGMSCEGCATTVKGALESGGIRTLKVDWRKGIVELGEDVDDDNLRELIDGIGYKFVKKIVEKSE